jgi:hypothetical protein
MLSDISVYAVNGAPAVIKALDKAVRLALNEATQVPKAEIKRRLRGGYTSGKYKTGVVWNSVRSERAAKDGQGVYTTRIGSNRDYALYWELGFTHAGNGEFYRVEVWKPALVATRDEMAQAFNRLLRKSLTRDLMGTTAQINRFADRFAMSTGPAHTETTAFGKVIDL